MNSSSISNCWVSQVPPNLRADLDDIIHLGQFSAGLIALLANKDVETVIGSAKFAIINNAFATPEELRYKAELDDLWQQSEGNKDKYFEGVKKIADRDMLAFDILMTAYPVSRAGNFVKGSLSTGGFKLFRISAVKVLEKPRNIWGRSADSIARDFKKEGYEVIIRGSNRPNNQSKIIEIKGHRQIQQIQVSPSSSRHGGPYYKISTSDRGIIKVVDKNTYKPTPNEKAIIIFK